MTNTNLPRMRTLQEAARELKKLDPDTAVTEYHIRRLAVSGVLPRVRAGKKYLINLDLLIEYLQNPTAEKFHPRPAATVNNIRRIS